VTARSGTADGLLPGDPTGRLRSGVEGIAWIDLDDESWEGFTVTRLAPGMINGRYELHRRLGRGGMAEVYLARDRALDRAVAVKLSFPALATDPGSVERFAREAQAAGGLEHPNIVAVYDWGEANGRYFVVTEYVEGESLAELIAREGRLHPGRAAEIALDIASALDFAHRDGGVIHGDVDPGNVLITRDGDVKVADFGIAGDDGDPRSDVHGLGCVLYEMIVGRPPSSGMDAIDPAIPETLQAIILMCLAENPANRYPSAHDMGADLLRYLEGARLGAGPALAPPIDVDATEIMSVVDHRAPTEAMQRPVARPQRRDADDRDDEPAARSYAVLVVLVVVLLAMAALLFLATRDRSSGGDEAAPDTAGVTVPRVVDMAQADAEATLGRANLVPAVETAANETVPAGTVVAQDPAANESVATGSEVTITVSSGPGTIAVPDLKGMAQDEATQAITDLGLVPSPKQVESQTVAEGLVVDTNPAAGTPTALGATIEIQVSARPSTATVPDVTGLREDEARAALEGAGFTVTTTEEPTRRRRRDGRVLDQNPEAGTEAPVGSEVEIVVGRRGGGFGDDDDFFGDGDDFFGDDG